jgi:hypothetical protein
VIGRTHTLSIYRRQEGAETDAYGTPKAGWVPVAEDVRANLQPRRGEVIQMGAGREVRADWAGFIPGGIEVRQDDAVVVTSGVGPERYRVARVGEQGGRWDTELLLTRTEEQIP